MYFKEFYSCPNCGHAICGEKRKYFVCPRCGSERCKAEELPNLKDKYCGHCGNELADAKREALELDKKEGMYFKEFYSCQSCGQAICGGKRKYFICPHCGGEVCKAEELQELENNYCTHCGNEIASARREALAEEEN